jgi:hypothetical protein
MANMTFCGYDSNGNLFIDGKNSGGGFRFAELPAASSEITDVDVEASIQYGGAVQWDGQDIAIAAFPSSSGPLTIYRVQVNGSTATVVGSTVLKSKNGQFAGQTWIDGSTIVAIVSRLRKPDNLGYWGYPDGGKPSKQIKKAGSELYGVAVSLAPHP